MRAKIMPEATYLRECLIYDPKTGILTWRERPIRHFRPTSRFTAERLCRRWNIVRAGKPAGCIHRIPFGTRYLAVTIDGIKYDSAHRLIWKMQTDEEPSHEVEHRDRNGVNNRWDNLRPATHQQNTCNVGKKRGKFPKGVWRSGDGKGLKFCSEVRANGVRHYLGTFGTPEEAHAAYCEALCRLHGEFANFGHPRK